MKKRKLKPVFEKTLIVICIILFAFIASIQDFNAVGGAIALLAVLTLALNLRVLRKYGRGIAYKEK